MFGGRRRRREEDLAAKDRWRTARKLMDEDVTVLGEQVAELHVDTLADDLDHEAADHYRRALENYDQAKALLAASETAEDVVAIEQVVADARYHRAAVIAIRDGDPLPERREPCFFNPQHGPSMQDVEWTPPGGTAAHHRDLRGRRAPPRRPATSRSCGWCGSATAGCRGTSPGACRGPSTRAPSWRGRASHGVHGQQNLSQVYLNQAMGGHDGSGGGFT